MSISLRIVLVLISIMFFVFVSVKLKKSEIELVDTIFWLFLSFFLILISIFPKVVYWGSYLLGFEAPVNFVFLFFIGVLLFRVFLLNLKISRLQFKVNELVQTLAVRENDKQKREDRES